MSTKSRKLRYRKESQIYRLDSRRGESINGLRTVFRKNYMIANCDNSS